jgi:hypothetical protein
MQGAAPSPAHPQAEVPGASTPAPVVRWKPPRFEVIPLDCEITAYAPAGDEPLF